MSTKILPGKYQHFKGKFYEVVGVARHSETFEELVVYRALYSTQKHAFGSLWVRPKRMFSGMVIRDGIRRKRFRYLGKQA